jgi:hypothetical protein
VTRELITDDALSASVQSPDGNCFVAYAPAALAFGSLAPTYVEAERMQSESPAAFTFTPDSTGVAWADATAARFQPLNDACEPVGTPVTLGGSTGTSTIVFLPD